MTAEEYTKTQTVSVSFTSNGMHVLEKHVYELMESYHKEASKELVEALENFVKHYENEDIIISDNIDSAEYLLDKYNITSKPKIEPDSEKPYLFYEGEKYYFGEEYEFRDCESEDWVKFILVSFDTTKKHPFNWVYIRKIDHTAKYKKLLLELKEQAEKDGVNLKEML